ncbi:hypothetical protein B0H17DRAFT_1201420 [Mycena rosella]|uniref:DUF6534 domain-containing protein n=1 Tax=Mycena rosella TaxID=1033263 RepID=A0AAD7DGH1_MYCRO|nr:hypothetical protein B0H17DRAFT_1201420 [Mycena rosella]
MDMTYGAIFIGVLFATFFQGVLTVQAYIYYESFPDDLRRLKLLVSRPYGKILDAAHLVLISQACYHYLVTSWGDSAALLVSTHVLDLHLIFVGLATLVCQAFFVHRIWTFSKGNWLLTGVLSTACLVAFALEVLISAQILRVASVAYFSHLVGEVVAVFTVGGVVDVAIALVLVFYLQQGTTHFDRTNFVVARVINYTVATGFTTSVLAVACLIAYLTAPHTFIFIAMHFSLGRLYTNSLLATLNSRRALRHAPHTQPSAPSFTVMTTRVVTTVTDDEYPMAARSPKEPPENRL